MSGGCEDNVVVSKKLAFFNESLIRAMTRLSQQYNAINLSRGMPDFDAPSQLIEAAVYALRHEQNQYPLTWGQLSLREAIANKVKDFNRIDSDPEKNITVTCGSTEAVTAAVLGLGDPGDRILTTDPFYENYVPDAILAGCKLLYVPLNDRNLELEEESLKTAMEKRPKLFILCTPHNPTGKIIDAKQLKLIADLCEEYDTVAITDEIYEHITYDGKKHISLATVGNMHDRTVTVNGASKTYTVTGWRVGWAIAEAEMTDGIRKVHDYLTIAAPRPFQEALVTALQFPKEYYTKLANTYDKKRKEMMKILDEVELEYHRPEGAYYILVNAPERFKNGQEFTDHLLEEAKVAVLPGHALYHDKDLGERKIRIAYCMKDPTLREAGRRIKESMLKLSHGKATNNQRLSRITDS